MLYFAAAQPTNIAKLTVFFQRFQTKEHIQRVNKTKSTGENAFNGDHFWTEGNHESSNNEKTLFWVFLQICDSCFNKTKSTGENAFKGDHFGNEGDHELSNDEKT